MPVELGTCSLLSRNLETVAAALFNFNHVDSHNFIIPKICSHRFNLVLIPEGPITYYVQHEK